MTVHAVFALAASRVSTSYGDLACSRRSVAVPMMFVLCPRTDDIARPVRGPEARI